MKIKVKLFAIHREKVGASEIELELERNTSVEKLRKLLVEKHPVLKNLESATIVSLNQKYAKGSDIITEGDDIALLPFIGGG